MKGKKLTKISLMLAAAVVSGAVGGALVANPVTASAEAKTYLLTDIFSAKSATIGKSESKVTSFELSDGGSVYIKRDLAFKWFESEDASYFNTEFMFTDTKFDSVSLKVESPSAWATEDDKATNVVTFEKTTNGLTAYVNKSDKEGAVNTPAWTAENFDCKDKKIGVSLNDTNCEDGEFNVVISVDGTPQTMNTTDTVSKFVNVGSTYSEYSASETYPLTFEAKVTDNTETTEKETTTVLLNTINGQKFDNISDDNKVTDTAPAVLVVNEAIAGFQLGTAFALEYDYLDVLSKNVTVTREYYQYNPAHTEVKYNTLSTSVYFYETSIPATENAQATTVYKKYGKEFLSVKITLDDGSFSEDNNDNGLQKKTYDLAWYAEDDAVVKSTNAPQVTQAGDNIDYIVLSYNEEGPAYRHLKAVTDDTDANYQTNVKVSAYMDGDVVKAAEEYQKKLDKDAAEQYAGSNSYLELQSLDKLIYDNNGYRSLKFTISYYTPTSDTPSTLSNRSYNALEIPVSSEGDYEFKVFAVDKAGNAMKYYNADGELVTLDGTNIWDEDFDDIPSFTFTIASREMKLKEESSSSARKDTEVLDATYTLDSFTVEGADNLQEAYALYKLDVNAFNALNVTKELHSVTFGAIADVVKTALAEKNNDWTALLNGKTYHEYYLSVYASLLAENNATLADSIYACFQAVGKAGDRVNNADDRWEKYKWNPDAKSFATVEEGTYVIFADYWEKEMPSQRAAAYKVIEVSDKVDEIKGEDNWLENNVVSVVLFAIAGVMLILIVILLLIKPSDETLEEVEEKAAKEKKKTKKTNKDE